MANKEIVELSDLATPAGTDHIAGQKGSTPGAATGKVLLSDLPISDATQTALDAKSSTSHNHSGVYDPAGSAATVQSDLDSHTGDGTNPHSVTSTQLGLGNVDNTADADKPVSTAAQTALDGKSATSHDHSGVYEPSGTVTTHESDPTSHAADVSQAEAEAGTEATRRWYSPLRVFQAVSAWIAANLADTDALTEGSSNLYYPSADKSKLAGVEAGADATDTANVTAAGAVMDSEIDADIKTLSLPANTTISAYGATVVDDADAATARATLDVDQAGTDNSTDVTLAGTPNYLTIAGQAITRGLIDLASHVTGSLPWASISGKPTTRAGYGITDAASTAQGTLADSATQPGDDADTLGSGAATDGQVLTADGAGNAAWEAGGGGGSGDFLADGTIPMTGEFDTDVGTFSSGVSDGASAVGYVLDTENTLANASAKLASWKNNGTEKAYIDKNGYIYADGRIIPDMAETNKYITTQTYYDTIDVMGVSGGAIALGLDSGSLATVQYGRPGIQLMRAGGDYYIKWPAAQLSTTVPGSLSLEAQNAHASGNEDGGDVVIDPGTGAGTGRQGLLILNNIPTSDPTVAGALWDDSGTLKISAG